MKIKKFLDYSFAAHLLFAEQMVETVFKRQFENLGLSLFDGLVLTSIYFEEGQSARPGELAKTLRQSKSTLSHTLNKLQSLRLIARKTHVKDRRVQLAVLTANGGKTCLRLIQFFDGMQNLFEDEAGGEEQIRKLNSKIESIAKRVCAK